MRIYRHLNEDWKQEIVLEIRGWIFSWHLQKPLVFRKFKPIEYKVTSVDPAYTQKK